VDKAGQASRQAIPLLAKSPKRGKSQLDPPSYFDQRVARNPEPIDCVYFDQRVARNPEPIDCVD
jgi:hypothetical protein